MLSPHTQTVPQTVPQTIQQKDVSKDLCYAHHALFLGQEYRYYNIHLHMAMVMRAFYTVSTLFISKVRIYLYCLDATSFITCFEVKLIFNHV